MSNLMFGSVIRVSIDTSSGDNLEKGAMADTQWTCPKDMGNQVGTFVLPLTVV